MARQLKMYAGVLVALGPLRALLGSYEVSDTYATSSKKAVQLPARAGT